MKMPFTLRPSPRAEAEAMLLFGEVPELLALIIRLGGEAFPTVHRVAGGWVVKASSRSGLTPLRESSWRPENHPAGAIALRALAPNLFVPADADLVPSLLREEAESMTRMRGLVFLPGGAALAFDPAKMLCPGDLIGVKRQRGGEWRALPLVPPILPLESIERDGLPEAVRALIEQAGEGIATESPGGSWLSGAMGWLGLASLARLLDTRKQSAALEDLLRKFREGRTEDALRRALPLGGDAGRGGGWTESDLLPTHDFGGWASSGDGGGGAGWWHTDEEMRRRLGEAYRQAAAEAQARGDFRRAAFIHGKLLGDWGEAARLLERAGLHEDAAVIYLHRLGDRAEAARAYEAAGRPERALALYRELGKHVEAGDLLRKLGNEPAALTEYRIAAENLAKAERFLPAAELFYRADLPVIAQEYLARGWATRPGADSMVCGERLATINSHKDSIASLISLIDEASETFRLHHMPHPAGAFLNHVARLASSPSLVTMRDDLQDRVRMELTALLRRERDRVGPVAAQGLVSPLLGQSSVWTASALADARVALAQSAPPARTKLKHRDRIRLHKGTVTAFTSDPRTGTLFVSFSDGTVKAYSPRNGLVREVRFEAFPPITDLALESSLGTLHVLRQDGGGKGQIDRLIVGMRTMVPLPTWELPEEGEFTLCGALPGSGLPYLALRTAETLWVMYSTGHCLRDEIPVDAFAAFLIPLPGWTQSAWVALASHEVVIQTRDHLFPRRAFSRSWPEVRASRLDRPKLASIMDSQGALQVAGIRDPDCVMISTISLEGEGLTPLRTLSLEDPALAVCWHYPGELAVIHRNGITWVKVGPTGCGVAATTPADLEGAVAAASSPLTREVWIVFEEGEIDRLPWPG